MASLNEGRKKSNFGTKRGAGNVDRTTSRSNMQDPSKTTPSKGGRQVPMPNLSKTVEQTPANKYIRNMQDKGIRVNQDFVDAQGVKASGAKPVKVGKSKPTVGQGQVNRTRAKGQAAAAGVNVTPEPSRRAPRNIPLGDTTRGGPVKTMKLGDVGAPSKSDAVNLQRMTTASPEQSKALQRNLDTSIEKPKAVKQSVVSKRAERFRQSFGTPTGANPRTGAPTYRPLATTTNLPKGVGGRAPSSRQYSKVKVGDLNAKETLKNIGTGASNSTTTSGSKLPKIKPIPVKTIAKVKQSLPAPKPSFTISGTTKTKTPPKLPSTSGAVGTPGKTLKFGQTSSGSFSYKPGNNPVSVSANPTRRRVSGAAGPSSRIDSGPKPPSTRKNPVTPQQARQKIANTPPSLGRGSTTIRKGSSTYKPPAVEKGSSGAGSGAFYGVFNAMSAAEREKARGQTAERQRNAALASGTGSTLGSIATTALLRGVIGKRASAFLGPVAGSQLGDAASGFVMGASASDKKWMAKANRQVQTGTPAQSATSRSGNTAIVRDANNKERVGYRAFKDGKAVYKHGNDPSSLAYTSSNPLERIGRRTAGAGVPYVSDYLKGYYSRNDEANRKAKVAAQRSRAGN